MNELFASWLFMSNCFALRCSLLSSHTAKLISLSKTAATAERSTSRCPSRSILSSMKLMFETTFASCFIFVKRCLSTRALGCATSLIVCKC